MRFWGALRFDILFQLRHGFYAAYTFVTALYILLLMNIPENFRIVLVILIIFIDTGVLSFFFIGGIVLLERSSNTFENLFVTPLRIGEYIGSKVLSLTIISLAASSVIVFSMVGIPGNPLLFLSGVILSSILFTLLGLLIATKARNINNYFILSIITTPIIILPLLDYFRVIESLIFYIFPTKATLVLLQASFETGPAATISPAAILTSYLVFIIWIAVLYKLVLKWFSKYVISYAGTDH